MNVDQSQVGGDLILSNSVSLLYVSVAVLKVNGHIDAHKYIAHSCSRLNQTKNNEQ